MPVDIDNFIIKNRRANLSMESHHFVLLTKSGCFMSQKTHTSAASYIYGLAQRHNVTTISDSVRYMIEVITTLSENIK